MPLPSGTRYRVHTTPAGAKVRLAFLKGRVVEAKNLATGATHTPAEFGRARRRTLKARLTTR
jgi:hypothetical protein